MASDTDDNSSSLTAQQLADQLAREVRDCLPGMRLPGRQALADHFGVLPHIARRAVELLADAGVVELRPREGAVVVDRGEKSRIRRVVALVDQPDKLFQQQILLGADRQCANRRLKLEVVAELPDLDQPDCLRELAGGDLAGIGWMFIGLVPPDAALLAWRIQGVNLVQVDDYSQVERANLVSVDSQRAIYQATEMLIDLGHRRIGYAAGIHHMSTISVRRMRGFQLALRHHDLTMDGSLLLDDRGDFGATFKLACKLLRRSDAPTALVAANQRMGCEVIAACDEVDLGLGRDLSVVSGGMRLRMERPQLARLSRMDEGLPEALGEAAVEVLATTRASGEPVSILLGSKWIDNGSVGPPSGP